MDGTDSGGIAWAMGTAAPMGRKEAFKPAEPLKEHVVQSIAFLKRVDKVELSGGDKKNFEFTIHLHSDPDDQTSEATSYKITRTAEDIDHVSNIAQDACSQHFDFHEKYNVPVCQLCEPFKKKVELPVTTSARLVHSTQSIQSTMEARIVALVRGAIVPPTNEKLFCEGVTRLPPAVAKFLLMGVDQTKL